MISSISLVPTMSLITLFLILSRHGLVSYLPILPSVLMAKGIKSVKILVLLLMVSVQASMDTAAWNRI